VLFEWTDVGKLGSAGNIGGGTENDIDSVVEDAGDIHSLEDEKLKIKFMWPNKRASLLIYVVYVLNGTAIAMFTSVTTKRQSTHIYT